MTTKEIAAGPLSIGERFKSFDYPSLEQLVANNGPTRIISKQNYENWFGSFDEPEKALLFDPDAFQPVHTVRVRTADGMVKELIRDGHHRTIAVYKNWNAIKETFPEFTFKTFDVTETALTRFYGKENPTRPKELSMTEYLKDVMAPTRQHSEIEAKRTLGHIFMGWEDTVGHEIAAEIPAFAAVTLLTSKDARSFGGSTSIQDYTNTIFDEHPQKDIILAALFSIDDIFDDLWDKTKSTTQLSRDKLQKEALELVTTGNEYIGGPDIAAQQIAGLFKIPTAKAKFALGKPGIHLDSLLRGKIVSIAGRAVTYDFDAIYHVITHPDYQATDLLKVLEAKHPSDAKKAIDDERELEAFIQTYKESVDDRALTPIEALFIKRGVRAKDKIKQLDEAFTKAQQIIAVLPDNSASRKKISTILDNLRTRPTNQITTYLRRLDQAIAEATLLSSDSSHVERTMSTSDRRAAPIERPSLPDEAANLQGQIQERNQRIRDLEAENVILRARISELEAQVETASPDATPVTVFRADALEDDKTMLIDIEATAKKIFVTKDAKSQKITEEKWAWLKDNLVYGMHHGLDAISHSLLPRMRTLREATKWEPNDPRIKLLIASHYLELVRAQEMKGVEGEMMSAIVDFKEKKSIPWSYVYTRLLEILLYADPVTDHETRSASLRFLNQRSSTMDFNQAQQEVVIPFLREKNLSWNEYIRRVLTPASELEEVTS